LTIPYSPYGNDTIDRYPLSYERRLTKILCITKEVFKNLKAASAEFRFRPKKASFKPKPSLRQKPLEKERLAAPRNNDRRTVGDKCTGSFEPLDLFTNKSSSFWREQNLKDWFKEQESYEDARYLECCPLNL
jgi:hypothetical protein